MSNLIFSKTVGDIEIQSGELVPTHVAPTGSIYSYIVPGQDKASIYINGGGSSWTWIPKPYYGEIWFASSAQKTTLAGTNVWTETTLQSWNPGLSSGVVPTGSANRGLGITEDGVYQVTAQLSYDYDTTTDIKIDWGVGIDGAAPIEGHWIRQGNGSLRDFETQTVTFNYTFTSGSVLTALTRTPEENSDVEINHGHLRVKMIGE